jgi:hypothetical protein
LPLQFHTSFFMVNKQNFDKDLIEKNNSWLWLKLRKKEIVYYTDCVCVWRMTCFTFLGVCLWKMESKSLTT